MRHPFFRMTGLRAGDAFGEVSLNTAGCSLTTGLPTIDINCGPTGSGSIANSAASGWEVDTSSGPGSRGTPPDCATGAVRVPSSARGLPSGHQVLARASNWPESGQGTGAEMVYYEHPGGGFVFSVGSITFGGSLVVDEHETAPNRRTMHLVVKGALDEARRRGR